MLTDKETKRHSDSTPMTVPVIKALGVHVILVLVMTFSFQSIQHAEVVEISVPKPQPIQAKAISSEEVKRLVNEKKRKENAARKAAEDKARRIKQEKDRKRKAEQDRKRKAALDKKRREDAAKKKKEDEARKKREEDARKKREEEARKKREEDARKKREEEARKQRAEEARIKAAQEKRVLSERDKYTALIKNKISRNWIVGNNTGVCILEVRLAPAGLVLDVREISGDAAICRSAKAAVFKSDPLPVSKDPAVFAKMRTIRLTLDPRDN